MEYGMWMALAFGVVTVVLLVWMVLQRRPASVDEAQTALVQAADLARVAVAAAEQLYKTGKLPDNDAKFSYALNLLTAQFPGVESKQLIATVEAAVYWLRQVAPQAPAGTAQPLEAQGLPMASRGKAHNA